MEDERHRENFREILKKDEDARQQRMANWVKGKGSIRMHPTDPRADTTPRDEFVMAVNAVAPEVSASLRELQPLYDEVLEAYRQENMSKGTSLSFPEQWEKLLGAVRGIERASLQGVNTGGFARLTELQNALQGWAKRWHLDESSWAEKPDWFLDHALRYLAQRLEGHFLPLPPVLHLGLTEPERTLNIEEVTPDIVFMSESVKRQYKRQKRAEWKAFLDKHLEQQKAQLHERLGTMETKHNFGHFLMVVLVQIFGYSLDTVTTAYSELPNRKEPDSPALLDNFPTRESLREGAKDVARLIQLNMRKLPGGKRKPGVISLAIEDVISRLDLTSFLKP
jgi:hypothetical protein